MVGELDPGSNSFVHANLWEANGPNSRIDNPVSLAPTVLGYSFDPSGNVVGRHPFGDHQQPVQSAQLFDAFGERIYDEESTALSDPIGYKDQWGCYTDPELPLQYQLVYCHNRYYSPYLGRWISRDPAGADGGLNAYEFCGNNPIMNSDPSGLFFYRATGENLPPDYGLTFADQFTDFWAGYGDTLTFSGTKWIRRGVGWAMGIGDPNDVVDYDSGGYLAGEVAGTVHSILYGGAQGWAKAGGKAAGFEFSHWIPNRYLTRAAEYLGADSTFGKWLVKGFGRSK